MQWPIVHSSGTEIGNVTRVVAGRCPVGDDVGRVSGNGDRRREIRLLPACARLVGEIHRRKKTAAFGPEVADMRAGILRSLIEAQSNDVARDLALEFHAQLDPGGIRIHDEGGHGSWFPH